VLPIRKVEIGQGHVGLDKNSPSATAGSGSLLALVDGRNELVDLLRVRSNLRQHLLHLRRQRAYGLGLRLHHVAYALIVLLALLAVLVELGDALVALALEPIGEALESGVDRARPIAVDLGVVRHRRAASFHVRA